MKDIHIIETQGLVKDIHTVEALGHKELGRTYTRESCTFEHKQELLVATACERTLCVHYVLTKLLLEWWMPTLHKLCFFVSNYNCERSQSM